MVFLKTKRWQKLVGKMTRSITHTDRTVAEFNDFADLMDLKFANIEPILGIITRNLSQSY